MLLTQFNTADAAEAAALVRVWADVPSFVDGILAARPYGSVDELAARAAGLAATWSETDLDAALAHHPRIGEKPAGSGAEAQASRGEQASMTGADAGVTARIAAGNAAYERRFGRVFLIRAAGRSPHEMLAELERRLTADPDAEWREAAAQLGEIAVLRLRSAVRDDRMGA
ncbi:2-oxo-4-hydroxy-4-carboxy-5-ureidoimidazoline decarboxylase [Microbacterium sp. NPDC078428]|uniref:2-oxo-4-hydroxy-4-carboxy-5-ureidoimidazoline decarboxylase n=1 Tax=Microbacterium sp. NPDC078428 TaxID=3364190 RepID=UPI0037CC9F82